MSSVSQVTSEDDSVQPESGDASEYRDALPDDLQPQLADHEDYLFPNNNRRRIPGVIYLVIAAGLYGLYFVRGEGVFINKGILAGAIILTVFGIYQLVSGWNLDVDERDALVASIDHVGFPVGHASAQMGWRGWLSRPTWRILIYSAENPPTKRGLVMVDGVDGHVVETLIEDNPEDWSDLSD